MDKIILIDKPTGWTSFDVVAKVRGVLSRNLQSETGEKRRVKVGHSGTLDPLASGLLVLATGRKTKEISQLTKLDKTYNTTLVLGVKSDTLDAEGELIEQENYPIPTKEEINDLLQTFLGEIDQTPPQYSAIKVDGVRAYKLARAGKKVDLPSRKVKIHNIENIEYEFPELKFSCRVSSGTYIRSLVADIGDNLGCGAYMSALRRTEVGDFRVEDADNSFLNNA